MDGNSAILANPTQRDFDVARRIASLHRDFPHDNAIAREVRAARIKAGMEYGDNTSASRRMYEKRRREIAMTPHEVAKLKLIPWSTVSQALTSLNKTISFTELPDAKVGIGFQKPTRFAVKEWEKAMLAPDDRKKVEELTGRRGPRLFLVAASRGHVSPYTDLISKGPPVEIVCRSLKSIVAVLVAHGGFKWDAAERAFGFRLLGPGTDIERKYLNISPKAWAEDRPTTRL